MESFILPIILIYSGFILAILFVVDLKTRLLPNKFVLQFLFCGIAFHIVTGFHYHSVTNMLTATILSVGLLLCVRAAGNYFYKADTLGMGDIKLMGAAGIWLGTDYIFLAISLGALAGIMHGIIYTVFMRITTDQRIQFTTLSIPAGPGFITGILIMALIKFHTLPSLLG